MLDVSSLSMPQPQHQLDSLLRRGEGLNKPAADGELEKTFHQFVGGAFFGQMLGAMRQTVGEPAYFHGGRGEEVFQGQLDQVLAEKMTEASAETFAKPMFDLFMLSRS